MPLVCEWIFRHNSCLFQGTNMGPTRSQIISGFLFLRIFIFKYAQYRPPFIIWYLHVSCNMNVVLRVRKLIINRLRCRGFFMCIFIPPRLGGWGLRMISSRWCSSVIRDWNSCKDSTPSSLLLNSYFSNYNPILQHYIFDETLGAQNNIINKSSKKLYRNDQWINNFLNLAFIFTSFKNQSIN